MKLYEERRADLEYKELKNKVEVLLSGTESASVTKLVNKYNEFDLEQQRAQALRKEVNEYVHTAQALKSEYEEMLRKLESDYFDVTLDSAKTKVVRTMKFVIKMSATPEAKTSESTDWEAAFNELAELLNAPIEVVKDVIKHNTEIETIQSHSRLYKPEEVKDLKESVISDIWNNLKEKIRLFYTKILNKLKIFDSIMDRLEEKYL